MYNLGPPKKNPNMYLLVYCNAHISPVENKSLCLSRAQNSAWHILAAEY